MNIDSDFKSYFLKKGKITLEGKGGYMRQSACVSSLCVCVCMCLRASEREREREREKERESESNIPATTKLCTVKQQNNDSIDQ